VINPGGYRSVIRRDLPLVQSRGGVSIHGSGADEAVDRQGVPCADTENEHAIGPVLAEHVHEGATSGFPIGTHRSMLGPAASQDPLDEVAEDDALPERSTLDGIMQPRARDQVLHRSEQAKPCRIGEVARDDDVRDLGIRDLVVPVVSVVRLAEDQESRAGKRLRPIVRAYPGMEERDFGLRCSMDDGLGMLR
jgi:hypothetical protein